PAGDCAKTERFYCRQKRSVLGGDFMEKEILFIAMKGIVPLYRSEGDSYICRFEGESSIYSYEEDSPPL
ncbi:MAG: hypothetical protein H6Q26_1507, partial [Bacteroidetes bacterium]|nr:hypothetical protein [Bacteroidota bacterium]